LIQPEVEAASIAAVLAFFERYYHGLTEKRIGGVLSIYTLN
jgi:hypothetical protein